ncbi:MAG: hypothetical protein IJM20_04550 [Clostridia bacterium]|nr:hypothetical protein [Clostridia bacterium]
MNALFTSILNMSIAGGVVIAVVMLGRLLIKNAPKKWSYLLWIAAAFRLCCPVSIRSAISLFRVLPHTETARAAGETASRLNYIPAAVNAPAPTAIPVPPTVLPIEPLPMASATADPSLITANPAPITSAPILAAPITSAPVTLNPVAGAVTNEVTNTATPASPLQVAMTVLTVLWLAGIAALIIYAIVDYIRLRKNVATATKLAGENKVFESENIRSPFILGFIRPRIYIPYGLSKRERQYVLAHERTHLRRGDHIIKAFSFVLLALHWFNPLCWLAFFLMSRDMEMSCDETVLAKNNIRKEYSTTLLSFAAGKRFSLPAPGPITFGETAVKERIKNAMKYKKPKLIVTIIAVMLCVVIVAACATNPLGEKPDAEKDANTETAEKPTPGPDTDATPTPSAEPSNTQPPKMVGVIFKNELETGVDHIRICNAGGLLRTLTVSEEDLQYYPHFDYQDSDGDGSIDTADPVGTDPYNYDICAYSGEELYVLHDAELVAGDTVTLRQNGGNPEFEVVSGRNTTVYPAEVYGSDPFTVGARDENILQFNEITYYGYVFEDNTKAGGYRVEWTVSPEEYDLNEDRLHTVERCVLVELTPEDEARFPALAAAIRNNNRTILDEAAKMVPIDDLIAIRNGETDHSYAEDYVNAAAYIYRADTRVVSILYEVWVGWDLRYQSYHSVDHGRKYFTTTYDTVEGRLLTPNEAAEGIDGNPNEPPHDPLLWTYGYDGITFYEYSGAEIGEPDEPQSGVFHPIGGLTTFNEEYLPFTENYVINFTTEQRKGAHCFRVNGETTFVGFKQRYTKESEYYGYYDLDIDVEGMSGPEPTMLHYSQRNYFEHYLDRIALVHCGGRDYFYVTKQLDNTKTVEIYAVSNGRLFLLSTESETTGIKSDFTDPCYFMASRSCAVVGCHIGSYHCAVNTQGLPIRTEWISYYEEHTVLKELEAKLVAEDGTATGETVVLQPGWKVIFFRTDGRRFEDMLLPDGRIARVEMDSDAYLLINGEYVGEYFDNIMIWD